MAYSHSRKLLFVSQLSSSGFTEITRSNVLVYDTSVEPMILITKLFLDNFVISSFTVISPDSNTLFLLIFRDVVAYDISNLTSVKRLWRLTNIIIENFDGGLDVDDEYLYVYNSGRATLLHVSNGMVKRK